MLGLAPLFFRAINLPYAVFKAVVRRSGENKVGPSELLDVSQSLELGGVDDFDEKRVQLDVTMDGVIKNLEGHTVVIIIVINHQKTLELCPYSKASCIFWQIIIISPHWLQWLWGETDGWELKEIGQRLPCPRQSNESVFIFGLHFLLNGFRVRGKMKNKCSKHF